MMWLIKDYTFKRDNKSWTMKVTKTFKPSNNSPMILWQGQSSPKNEYPFILYTPFTHAGNQTVAGSH